MQHHMARREHYDLRLEWKGVMLSWAVPKGPSFNPKEKRLAIQVEDHPLEYRDFEGTIPKGEYGGGTVMIWDEGFWEPEGDADDALREGALKFSLFGKRLKGNWALIRLEQKKGEDKVSWLLLKEKDEHALDEDGIDRYAESVRTGRTMEEIERGEGAQFAENPFDEAEPQLPKLVKPRTATSETTRLVRRLPHYSFRRTGRRQADYEKGAGLYPPLSQDSGFPLLDGGPPRHGH